MPERIVVSFRGVASAAPDAAGPPADGPGTETPTEREAAAPTLGAGYLTRALALKKRAEALGATLCAWGARSFAFDLGPDELEEAIALATHAVEDPGVPPEERLSVGIAQGEMTPVAEWGRLAVLSWGQPLLEAEALSRVAPAGEVLVEPGLPAARSGELLLLGSHRSVDEGRRVRGLRLDARQPFRRVAGESVARLRPPTLVGRVAELEQLAVPPSCVGVIRAEPGAGGTRLLLELVHRLSPSRTLFVAPVGASREPLGAIRRALSRAAALGVEPGSPAASTIAGGAALPERLREALARLLAGEGADPWSVAELIDAWLAPAAGRLGLLLVDDAGEIDPASLYSIATAMSVRGSLRAIVRLNASEPLPVPLGGTTVAATVALGPLAQAEGEELARRFFGGCITDSAARRWARRGAGSPLAIREGLCEGLETGALRWLDRSAEPRRRGSGRGLAGAAGGGAARRFIDARVAGLGAGERAVLTALALLGGDASDVMIEAVLAAAPASPGARVDAVERALTGAAWVIRPEPGWLRLSSRTLRDALLAAIGEDAITPWHAAARATLQQHGGALGLADAAWHALRAGDRRAAAELAVAAARTAGRALLEPAEAELLAFAAEHQPADADTSTDAGDDGLTPPPTYRMPIETYRDPVDVSAFAGAPRAHFDTLNEEHLFASSPPPPPAPRAPRAPAPSGLLGDHAAAVPLDAALEQDAPASVVDPYPSVRIDHDPLAKTTESPSVAMTDVVGRLVELAKQALLKGDLPMLERLVSELHLIGGHAELVERMTGFIALGRGAKAEALQRLRAATEDERLPARRARALLAYGVALAAAGRTEAALLEVLTALARTREAGDRHGEHACARFLVRLCVAAGHEDAARTWVEVARRVAPARAD
jgi:hypothetical protein